MTGPRGWLPRWLARRSGAGILALLAVSLLTFTATSLLPGDAATSALGDQATPERIELLRTQLHLDDPAPQRYLEWLAGLLHGDLGRSLQSQRPVSEVLSLRLGNTLALAGAAFVVVCLVGLTLGLLAGAREGSRLDRTISGLTLGVVALPEFVSATALIVVLAVALGLVPATSLVPPGSSPWSDPSILVLPVLALAAMSASYLARVVRGATVDVMRRPYVEAVRLRGVAEHRVLMVHVLPNALAPAVQVLGGICGYLVGGTVVIETVFAYPGLGQSLAQAVQTRDVVLVQGLGMLVAAVTLLAYLLADLASLALSPRARTAAT